MMREAFASIVAVSWQQEFVRLVVGSLEEKRRIVELTLRKKTGSALATVSATSLDGKTITRAQANEMLKACALERFHEDRAHRESNIREFEAEFGRSDRIDATLLNELKKLQMRLAAIATRQRGTSSANPRLRNTSSKSAS